MNYKRKGILKRDKGRFKILEYCLDISNEEVVLTYQASEGDNFILNKYENRPFSTIDGLSVNFDYNPYKFNVSIDIKKFETEQRRSKNLDILID